MFMSFTDMVNFTNGYEDSKNIDFSKMTTKTLIQYVRRCKRNAAKKNSSYWLGMAAKAKSAAMIRSI